MNCSRCTTSPAREGFALAAYPATIFSCARLAAVALALAGLAACSDEPRLPGLGADITRTSVSGLSSGAYMAGQFQFAHSKMVIGAGIVAGGPYGCAESVFGRLAPVWPMALSQNLNRALNGCMKTVMASLGVPDIERLARRVRSRAASGVIDEPAGLAGSRVYLFAGKKDDTVNPSLVRKAAELYAALGVADGNILLVSEIAAGHGFVTQDAGGACGATAAPFLNDCDYDQAGAILKHVYGPLKPPDATDKGELVLFGQGEFAKDSGDGFDSLGAAFVPRSCREQTGCRVHIAFHGCRQGRETVRNAFIESAGYNRWAAANRIVVLYPQVAKSAPNPLGCWDWWGYTGPEFLTRGAPQIRAVRAMLDRLATRPAS